MSPVRIGELVQRHRRSAGLTQDALAARSGVSIRALRDIEHDRVRQPHADSLQRLVVALDLSAADRDELLSAARVESRPGGDQLRVDVLGPLTVSRGGRAVAFATSAQRGLLGLLALRLNRSVTRDEIVEMLWGAQPPKTAVTQIHMAVGQLRTMLEPARAQRTPGGVIQLEHAGYLLRLDDEQVDLARFAAMLTRARSLRDRRPAEALDLLEQALRWWRGPVLADANPRLRDHPVAAEAGQQRLVAALLLADVAIELRRYERAVTALRHLAQDEPYHEGVHARLMLSLAGGGERAAALRLFAEVRDRLIEELGVEPAQEMQAAHLRVLRNELPEQEGSDAGGDLPDPAGGQRREPWVVVPSLLPPDIADFTGREEPVDEVRRLLTGGSPALLIAAIAGMGGIGKTALAVHVAHLVSGAYPDGQLYVNLRGSEPRPPEPGEVLARFLRSLGVDNRAVPDDVVERAALYRSRLADRRVLVVLDNAASEEQVRPLLPGAATCAVLVTSRARLTGVEGARWIDLDVFDPDNALRLLGRIAGEQRVGAEHDDAAEILRLCGGLPLAVRVAGARLTARPGWRLAHFATLLADERRRLDRLATGDLEVRASLALSYQGLPETAARLFRMLGLFTTQDFPHWLAASLLGISLDDATEHVDALVDAQLLAMAAPDQIGQIRYRYHDLVRLYARERAEAEDGADGCAAVLARGLGAWLAFAERMAADVPGPCYAPIHGSAPRTPIGFVTDGSMPRFDALDWFDAEQLALRASIRQACDLGLDELAFGLAGCLEKYFDIRAMYVEWQVTNELVIETCRRNGNLLGEAVMLRGLVDVRTWNGGQQAGEAMAVLRSEGARLLEMFTELGERRGMADAAVVCSWGLTAQGAVEEAVAMGERSLHLAEETGHVGGQARAHVALALAYGERARLDRSLAHLNTALGLARALGTPRYESTVLQFLGIAYREAGDLDSSRRALAESLVISGRYRDHYAEVLTMLALARVHLLSGDPRARDAAATSLAVGREYTMTHHVAEALQVLGEIELAEGRPVKAVEHLEESVRLWRTRGWPSFLAAALAIIGRAYRETDRPAARRAWAESLDLYTGLGDHLRVGELTTLIEDLD
ncbi:BTAD domain-containing putative transcriptional regulator [Micromonospora sp. NBC_01796]|uniref:BTAD domain-containing putative transcriptional regulator n=1 Tax=Micromonospora sp. NBC_01796 TaxID=2975987 RepID=UPI002DDADCED|nr:BTAD domain-containing putative transcriptional regulator [Micromonospora sp. NBC_01796]WSA85127.1 NB-ARC domain-containing protein [Micromonospora sp. NBC_01796]